VGREERRDCRSVAQRRQVALPGVPHDSLAATISDNEAWQIAGSWTGVAWKASGGFEHITFSNPSLPVAPGFSGPRRLLDQHHEQHRVSARQGSSTSTWLGLKYNFTKDFDITGAWYGYSQDDFGAVPCSDNRASNCSGNEDVYSLRLDYRFTKRSMSMPASRTRRSRTDSPRDSSTTRRLRS
jgi:predicted porin